MILFVFFRRVTPTQLRREITMSNSDYTLEELMETDRQIDDMKRHPIDYSDIPPRKPGAKVRLGRQAWLDSLPREVVLEMARPRLKQMQAAGYPVPESLQYLLDPNFSWENVPDHRRPPQQEAVAQS
jgi:hypothetical protein